MLLSILQNDKKDYVNTAVNGVYNIAIINTFYGFLYFKPLIKKFSQIFSYAKKIISNNILYDNKDNINSEINDYHNSLYFINKSVCMQADDCTFDTFLTFLNISSIPAVWGAAAGRYYILFLFLIIILFIARHDSCKVILSMHVSRNIKFHSILINAIGIGGLLFAIKQLYIKSIYKNIVGVYQ